MGLVRSKLYRGLIEFSGALEKVHVRILRETDVLWGAGL